MKLTKILLTLIAVFAISLGAFAQTESLPVDASTVVVWLTPFIVLAATALVKKLTKISGSIVLVVVPVLSGIVAYLTGLLANPELGFTAQFLLGLVSTFIHQIYSQLKKE